MPDSLPDLITTTKQLATPARWGAHDDQFRAVCALDIDGVTMEGLWLRGQCIREIADRRVTFQLEWLAPGWRRGAVARLDWRPESPHGNKNIGPAHLRLMVIEGSHHHPFALNWPLGFQRMFGENLPIAKPLDVEPASFRDLTVLAGRLFNIQGMEAFPVPPWEPRLGRL